MMQRQPLMFQGMQQALAQQQPRAAQPPQQPMWNGAQQSPWLQQGAQALRGMGQALGAQAQNWGDPGQGVPTIRPPMNRGAGPMQQQAAQQTQQMAQRYAQGLPRPGGQGTGGIVNEEDPRFSGMR